MSCHSEQNFTNTAVFKITPPFKGINVPYSGYEINPQENSIIETERGTLIEIPANSLVNQKGELIKDMVDVQFRAFHTNTEIIASGIPMTYDSAGRSSDFISAGMFEIRAKCNGENLSIKPGAAINIELASFVEGNEFNFYTLNETTGNWAYKGTNSPQKNTRKTKRLKNFFDQFVMKLDVDYSAYRELKAFHGLSWVYYGNDPNEDPRNNPWIFKEKWRQVKLSAINNAKGIYNMHLTSKNNTLDLPVSPYIEGDSAAFITALNEGILQYNDIVKARKQEEDKIQLEADITRNFEIAEFGYHNWDRLNNLIASGEFWRTEARFKIGEQLKKEKGKIYLFTGKEKKMLVRDAVEWADLVYPQNEENTFIVVLPDNYVAICGSAEFSKATDQQQYDFSLSKYKKRIENIDDLEALINNI